MGLWAAEASKRFCFGLPTELLNSCQRQPRHQESLEAWNALFISPLTPLHFVEVVGLHMTISQHQSENNSSQKLPLNSCLDDM